MFRLRTIALAVHVATVVDAFVHKPFCLAACGAAHATCVAVPTVLTEGVGAAPAAVGCTHAMSACYAACGASCFDDQVTVAVVSADGKTDVAKIRDVQKGQMVMTVKDGVSRPTRVVANHRHEGRFRFVKVLVRLENGQRELSVTENHNVLVHRNGLQLIPAANLVPGDKLPVGNDKNMAFGRVVKVQKTERSLKHQLVTADGTVLANNIHVSTICDGQHASKFGDAHAALAAWRRLHTHLMSGVAEMQTQTADSDDDVQKSDLDLLIDATNTFRKYDLNQDGDVHFHEVLASSLNVSLNNMTCATMTELLTPFFKKHEGKPSDYIKNLLFPEDFLESVPERFENAIEALNFDADNDGKVSVEDVNPLCQSTKQLWTFPLIHIKDYETSAHFYIKRFEASENIAILQNAQRKPRMQGAGLVALVAMVLCVAGMVTMGRWRSAGIRHEPLASEESDADLISQ